MVNTKTHYPFGDAWATWIKIGHGWDLNPYSIRFNPLFSIKLPWQPKSIRAQTHSGYFRATTGYRTRPNVIYWPQKAFQTILSLPVQHKLYALNLFFFLHGGQYLYNSVISELVYRGRRPVITTFVTPQSHCEVVIFLPIGRSSDAISLNSCSSAFTVSSFCADSDQSVRHGVCYKNNLQSFPPRPVVPHWALWTK